MATWDATFEAAPDGGNPPSTLDDAIRAHKAAVEERMKNEHTTYSGDSTSGTASVDWRHKKGSARAYYQSAAPTNQPGTAGAALGSGDDGRLFVDSDTNIGFVWDGSAMQPIRSLDLQDPSGDADVEVDYASDASLLWDESEDEFVFNKPLKATSFTFTAGSNFDPATRYFHYASIGSDTGADLYSDITGLIPNVGDTLSCTGGLSYDGDFYTLVYVTRSAATTIQVYGAYNGGLGYSGYYFSVTPTDSNSLGGAIGL